MIARVTHVSSHELADRILATDLAVLHDSTGYLNRRATLAEKRVEVRSGLSYFSADARRV